MAAALHPDRNFDTIAARAQGVLPGLAALCAGAVAWPVGPEAAAALLDGGALEPLEAAGELRVVTTLSCDASGMSGIEVCPLRAWLAAGASGRPGGPALALVRNAGVGPYLARPLQMGADLVLEDLAAWTPGRPGARPLLALVARTEAARARWDALAARAFLDASSQVEGSPWGLAAGELDALGAGLAALSSLSQRRSDNALVVAHYLAAHPRVARVSYPGLEADPANDPARRTLEHGFGPLVAFSLVEGAHLRSAAEKDGLAAQPAVRDCRTSSVAPLAPAATYLLTCGLESPLDIVALLEELLP
jgi:hypothetical protein